MIATNIEQSKKLLHLGIDKETADMAWTYYDKQYNLSVYGVQDELNPEHPDIPAWSLESLLNILNFPMIYQCEEENSEYYKKWRGNALKEEIIESEFFDTPIEACIDLIEKHVK